MAASVTTLNLSDGVQPRIRKPWEVLDEEIAPHLTMDMVFGDLQQLRRDGRYYQACCPIHQGDEGDAFSLDPDRLEWICFLGCGGGGPIQFLEKTQRLTWMEAAQALAVMAGVDPARLRLWGQHWAEKDFDSHQQLERRSSLLRIFMAFSRSLLLSPAGRSIRLFLKDRYGLTEEAIRELELGLYTTTADVFHYLKRTGQDLGELRGKGLFEPVWTGRLVAPWRDVSGRTVNLWSWDCGKLLAEGPDPGGDVLFERDQLGAQQTPFQLGQALAIDRTDLILLDGPLQALVARGLEVDSPYPVSFCDRLTNEQVDLLERVLDGDGSVTLLSSYDPDRYGTRSDQTFRSMKLLEKVSFPVYAIDAKLLADNPKKPATVEEFIRRKGLDAFKELIQQAEVMLSPSRARSKSKDSLLPGLGRVFRGRSRRESTWEEGSDETSGLPWLGVLLGAAEEIGQRIARGFLKAMPGDLGRPALPGGPPQLVDGGVPQLPAAEETPPPVFSVDRLEMESWHTSLAKPSGWRELDELGVRFRPGELVVLGGAQGHGRTSLIIGLLVYWLYRTEENFVVYSFDESEVQIYHRFLSLLTAVAGNGWPITEVRNHLSSRSQRSSQMSLSQVEVLETAKECLRGWENRLHVVFRPTWTLTDIDQHLRTLAGQAKVGAVFIDPADRVAHSPAGQNHAAIPATRWLKGMSVEHSCPVIASLRLPPVKTKKKKKKKKEAATELVTAGSEPIPFSLRQVDLEKQRPRIKQFPNELTQEADLVLGLLNYAAAEGFENDNQPDSTPFEIGILKNRSGAAGDWVSLRFEPRFCMIQNA